MRYKFLAAVVASLLLAASAASAQTQSTLAENSGQGDSVAVAPPLAHLSPAFKRKDVAAAMRKVGDWELARSQPYFSRDWTFAALYAGFMAAAHALPERRYEDAMLAMGNTFDWTTGPRKTLADDQAVAQTYIGLYRDYGEVRMIIPTEGQLDSLMKQPDNPKKPVWWWCDALFMAPPVWARMYGTTSDIHYLNYMDREWWVTSNLLYDPQQHLFSRDATFLDKHEPNGQKLFWSRGNGWVMAGLARVLEKMPNDYPTRAKYVEQFKQMASRIAELQGQDGLWRPGLLDAQAYPLPELSGSGFFVYALAWGVNHQMLDRKKYLPVIEKGWAGLLDHVYEDGRLGCIQPIGAAPGAYTPTSSYVYGVGAFLLAGSEVMELSKK
ncbi:MAG TPA: glycoside hydrolase family 88 protein [Acidobacteriaceae bacterium]|nr:glycoside hydrolase family 88 protein [Acidobacteriaceae bacterium]